jgi:hypothetical protein
MGGRPASIIIMGGLRQVMIPPPPPPPPPPNGLRHVCGGVHSADEEQI